MPAAERSRVEPAGSRPRRFRRIHAPRSGRAERDQPVPCLSPAASGRALERNESRPPRASARGRGGGEVARKGADGNNGVRRLAVAVCGHSAQAQTRRNEPRSRSESGRSLPPPSCGSDPGDGCGRRIRRVAWVSAQRGRRWAALAERSSAGLRAGGAGTSAASRRSVRSVRGMEWTQPPARESGVVGQARSRVAARCRWHAQRQRRASAGPRVRAGPAIPFCRLRRWAGRNALLTTGPPWARVGKQAADTQAGLASVPASFRPYPTSRVSGEQSPPDGARVSRSPTRTGGLQRKCWNMVGRSTRAP